MSLRPPSSRIAVALLASVTAAALIFPNAVLAGPHGGGGGGGGGHGGGGGGFHGGGGGGFHMGGGGGFHMGGGGGGFHMGGGGGGLRMGGGGGGFRMRPADFAAHGVSRSFAGHGFAGHGFAGHGFAGRGLAGPGAHTFAGRSLGGRTFAAHGNAGRFAAGGGLAATHNALAAHAQFGGGHTAITRAQFAHNQFAARNFHGLHNFSHTGFNRNAFGDPGGWNRWGGRFWGAGWNNWGWGWGGWAGPVFWPFLFGDIFSFAVWPYDYYDPFWAFGPDFILVSIFAPGPYFGPDYGYAPDYTGYLDSPDIYYGGGGYAGYYGGGGYAGRYAGRSQAYQGPTETDRRQLEETNAAATESCNALAPGVSDLPIERIKNTVRPTGDQLAALDDLSAATAKANDAIKASCPTAVPLTPMARLDAAEARLQAMIQAVDIVREPLQRFSVLLSDEQRQRFNAMVGTGGGQAPAGGNVVALCSERSGDVTKVPVQRIEQVLQPSGQQQDAFQALKRASQDAAAQLQGSCPSEMPQTPDARLDAVKTRLTAMVDAMNIIRPKLQDFYASLNDDQKAKFNIMGPPPNASAQQKQSGGQ